MRSDPTIATDRPQLDDDFRELVPQAGTGPTSPYGTVATGQPPPLMLDFRGHNGTSFALHYADLIAIGFHPSDEIILEFRAHKVTVQGRNLRPVYSDLLNHRTTFVQEEDFDGRSESDTFVDSIALVKLDEPL